MVIEVGVNPHDAVLGVAHGRNIDRRGRDVLEWHIKRDRTWHRPRPETILVIECDEAPRTLEQ
jgi:hypothetical protein